MERRDQRNADRLHGTGADGKPDGRQRRQGRVSAYRSTTARCPSAEEFVAAHGGSVAATPGRARRIHRVVDLDAGGRRRPDRHLLGARRGPRRAPARDRGHRHGDVGPRRLRMVRDQVEGAGGNLVDAPVSGQHPCRRVGQALDHGRRKRATVREGPPRPRGDWQPGPGRTGRVGRHSEADGQLDPLRVEPGAGRRRRPGRSGRSIAGGRPRCPCPQRRRRPPRQLSQAAIPRPGCRRPSCSLWISLARTSRSLWSRPGRPVFDASAGTHDGNGRSPDRDGEGKRDMGFVVEGARRKTASEVRARARIIRRRRPRRDSYNRNPRCLVSGIPAAGRTAASPCSMSPGSPGSTRRRFPGPSTPSNASESRSPPAA